jgi:hypothetical protein
MFRKAIDMESVMPKRFNVAGPCVPDRHYMLPAVNRLPEARQLVEQGDYFVIHAARQSGKTTLLKALTREINAEGRHYAIYCSLETLQRIEDLDRGLSMIVYELNAATTASPIFQERQVEEQPAGNVATGIRLSLSGFSAALDKPLILFFDEVDCLSGQTLITFLRQLRYGYINRDTTPFPWSIALVGMRDIRDFKAQVRPEREALGSASPFNIVTEALTLSNFTAGQVGALYGQHTEATKQVFEPEAIEQAWHWSEGQPWLVNALARQVVEDDLKRDYSLPVTAGHIDAAADALMKRRDTHIDSLLDRLREPRVRKVIEPVITGGEATVDPLSDDTRFCLDLGLVKADAAGALSPANPIYREVMVRTLTYHAQVSLPANLANRWLDDKNLDLTALLREFQRFWRENADIWLKRYEYQEAAPHLILQAFLQRVVNGGALILREMATGRGRMDLGILHAGRKYVMELKLAGREPLEKSLEQTAGYMDTQGVEEAWLVTFDRGQKKPWDEKLFWEDRTLPDGKLVHIVGC